MSLDVNPFKTLGLDRDLVRKLDDRSIASLVESQYRLLQRIYHPDVGGDEAVSRALNEARAALDPGNPESYAHYKSAYVRRSGLTRADALGVQAAVSKGRHNRLLGQVLEYIRCRLEPGDEPSVFTRGPFQLGVHDYVLAQTLPLAIRKKDSSRVFHELRVRRDGSMVKVRRGRTTEVHKDRVLVGTVAPEPPGPGSGGPLIRLLRQLTPGRPVLSSRHRSIRYEHPRAGANPNGAAGRISPDAFFSVIDLLSPHLTTGSFLFSASSNEHGLYFQLEGKIVSSGGPT
jgi:hypothetical protein